MKQRNTTIIGIDCATQPENVGLAFGRFNGRDTVIREVVAGRSKTSIHETLAGWLAQDSPTLLALDAPLGWPIALGDTLHSHKAGGAIKVEANELFRRLTDRQVRDKTGKQSLDVGADRIARTAHSALKVLQDLREQTGHEIPLAWKPELDTQISAIEIYPAATLIAHDLKGKAYKGKDGKPRRESLLRELARLVRLPQDLRPMVDNDDALDAALGVLAGTDFLRGDCYQPTNMEVVRKEGWIWVRKLARGTAEGVLNSSSSC